MNKYYNLLYVILFTVYGQLIIKWRMTNLVAIKTDFYQNVFYLIHLLFTDIYIFSGIASAFIASLIWMNVVGSLQLNIAYPILSLSFAFVFLFSSLFFGESVSVLQVIGLLFILTGVGCLGFSIRSAL